MADDDETAVARFPAELRCIAAARSFVADQCRKFLAEEATETAVLLTGELVTNAVVHAGSAFAVEVSTPDSVVRVGVGDDSDVAPKVAQSDTWDDHGRGLAWVQQLSHSWGVMPRHPGKTVWFTVDRGV
jgi:anti-sigma regulatory factor (Ser/Thr protein kinase)